MGIFCQILALFQMPAHQIGSCHVIQDVNFENFLLCPNSTFNIRKSHKISGGKALYFRSYQLKNLTGGGKHPTPPSPSYFRVKALSRYSRSIRIHCFISVKKGESAQRFLLFWLQLLIPTMSPFAFSLA